MPLVLADRVRETTTTTGTGTISLAGPVSGFQGFSTAIGNANTTYYTIVDAATGAWEVGLGTYTSSGSTLARTTVLSSSNSDALVPFGAGTKDVFVTQPAERAVYVLGAGTGLAAGAAAFTANGVPFADSTNTLTTGSNLTYVEGGNNQLTVNSASASYFTAAVGANTSYFGTSGIGTYVGSGTNVPVVFYQNNTEGMRLTSSGLSLTANPTLSGGTANGVAYLNASKVLTTGSALTFDGTNLGVGGAAFSRFSTATSLIGNNGYANAFRMYDDSSASTSQSSNSYGFGFINNNALSYTAGGSGSHVWFTANTEQMRLTSTGLGIGTSSPFTRLESAAARATTLNSIASFNTMAASVTDTTAFAVGVGGGINFRARLNSSAYSTYASIWSFREAATTDDYKGSLIFGTSDNGDGYPEERARINSSGNLGLGVTPSAWGSGFKAIQISTGGGWMADGANLYFSANSYWNGTNWIRNLANAAARYQMESGAHSWYTAAGGTAGDPITFIQAMTLDASGRLYVGPTSAASVGNARFAVTGGATYDGQFDLIAQLTNDTTSAGKGVLIGYNNTSNTGIISAAYGNGSQSLAFWTHNNSSWGERMRLDSSGNLGIGTSSPLAKLNVVTTGGKSTIAIGDTASSTYSQLLLYGGSGKYNWSVGAQYNVNNAFEITPSTSAGGTTFSTPALVIDSSGNLGIGTSSPAYKLDVNGAARVNNLLWFTPSSGLMAIGASGTNFQIYNGAGAETRLTVDNSGNLGLGVTPSAWQSIYRALDVPSGSFFGRNDGGIETGIYANAYRDSAGTRRYRANGVAMRYEQSADGHTFFTASSGTAGDPISFTQAMTLDASGNLGVGTTSPSSYAKAAIVASVGSNTLFVGSSTQGVYISNSTGTEVVYNASGSSAGSHVWQTGNTERARITSGGDFNFGVAATNAGVLYIQAGTGVTTGRIIDAIDALGARYFEVQTDGDVYNTNGTYGTISDQKLKQDIVDAGSQWADIKAIRFRKYRMKSDVAANPDAPALLGVVAQELEQVSPGLVDEHPDMETVEVTDEDGNVTQTQQPTGTTTKTVKSSILLMKAAVALQEAMARIEKLEAEVATLKGA